MNKHLSPSETVACHVRPQQELSPARVTDIQLSAEALAHHALILRSTPRHPQVAYLYDARLAAFNEAVEDMRQVLADG